MNRNNVITKEDFLGDNFVNFSNKIKHKQRRIYLLGLIFMLAIFFILQYTKYIENIDIELKNSSCGAISAFEASDYSLAISGNSNFLGLESLVKKKSSINSVRLLKYYLGVSYLSIGKYKEAIDILSNTRLRNQFFESLRLSLIGDCFFEIKDYKNSAFYYIKAANNYSVEYFTPNFFEKAAIAYEMDLNLDKALECYSIIHSKYTDYKKSFTIKNLSRLIVLKETVK